ncbi:MAG: dihydroneopterin aldolase [Rhodospirillales bacterium CG15_BIG_FIL_POST_REV_8_21_14_020_66_15]|nr:MAG: dihydroneopterin aldolase [Rhodospirillales bacterium CG15_BIG_FIL_POST_REV_8_21_14_020_66_15]
MTVDQYKVSETSMIADARSLIRHVFVRNLVLMANIGIHAFEKTGAQRIRVNVDLAVRETDQPPVDEINQVVCYEEITDGIKGIVGRRHVNLVETLAEDIAAMCLEDPRVRSARVRVEKLDIFENAESVGVEIERFSSRV